MVYLLVVLPWRMQQCKHRNFTYSKLRTWNLICLQTLTEMMRCAMRLATIYLTHQIKIRHLVIHWVQIMYGDISHFSHAAVEPRDKIWEWPGNEAMVTYGWTINESHLPKMTVNYLALQKRNVGLIKNEFDDQLLVPDQGWNSNYIMYYWMNMHMGVR